MSQNRVFASLLSYKFMVAGIYFCMATLPFLWVFTHPWSPESSLFIGFALLIPIIAFLYSFLIHKVEIRDSMIHTRNFLGLTNVPGTPIASIAEIESHRSARGLSLFLKLVEPEQIEIPVNYLSLDQQADFLLAIKNEKPDVLLPKDFAPILDPSLNREQRKVLVKNLQRSDNKQVMKLIGYATVIVVAILFFKLFMGEDINPKELADIFVSFF